MLTESLENNEIAQNMMKSLIKEAFVELLTERKDLFIPFFQASFMEFIEDYGMAKAIKEISVEDRQPASQEELDELFSPYQISISL